jgi:hypothetical protein
MLWIPSPDAGDIPEWGPSGCSNVFGEERKIGCTASAVQFENQTNGKQ